jgi:transmembrane sensor
MQEHHSEIGEILAKYPAITAEEEAILKEWAGKNRNQQVYDELTDQDHIIWMLETFERMKQEEAESWTKLQNAMRSVPSETAEEAPRRRMITRWYLTVAASIILVISSVFLFKWYSSRQDEVSVPESQAVAKNNDVPPGQFKAKLTLADGSVVVLDTISSNRLVQQGGTTVYTRNGQLVYEQKAKHTEVLYNTLTTSKGETYGMVLSDGSKVWLNSQSSLRYPVAFSGNERRVEITGEAYFEVATDFVQKGNKSVKQPFKVVVDNMEVEVLGTRFNINAYADEEVIKTTLLEGKVKIVSDNMSSVLAPGQEAQLKRQTKLLQVMDNADVEQAVAWKNGFFQFSDDDLRTVMRQLARWYDVEVVYQGGVGTDTYGGRINRNSKASEVLTLLERNRVHFKIQGKKIIVTP